MKEMHFEIFERKDYTLLNRPIPMNPCNRCSVMERATCFGCEEKREYDRILKPFKDSNLVAYAEKIRDLENHVLEIKKSINVCKEICDELPKDVKENVSRVREICAYLEQIQK